MLVGVACLLGDVRMAHSHLRGLILSILFIAAGVSTAESQSVSQAQIHFGGQVLTDQYFVLRSDRDETPEAPSTVNPLFGIPGFSGFVLPESLPSPLVTPKAPKAKILKSLRRFGTHRAPFPDHSGDDLVLVGGQEFSDLLTRANYRSYIERCKPAVIQYRKAEASDFRGEVSSIVDEYDRACLSAIDRISTELPEPSRTEANRFVKSIFPRIGVLWDARDQVFCSGFLVDSQNFLTARHCLFQSVPGRVKKFARRVPESIILYLAGSPAIPRKAIEFEDPAEPNGSSALWDSKVRKNDYALVRLSVPVMGMANYGNFADRPPARLSKILVPGFHGIIAYFGPDRLDPSLAGGSVPTLTSGWKDFIRFDTSGASRIYASSHDGCIHHNSHTDGGMSGAPIFEVDKDGNALLLGVHSGAIDRFTDCWSGEGENIPNVGSFINSRIIGALSSR